MSFGGGGSTQYNIDYVIRVINQGGTANTGIQKVSEATKQMTAETQKATVSQEQLVTAQNKVTQAGLGVSKAAKGMTFGILGITTAGAEMIGMMSMWQQTQVGVKEAQAEVNQALEEGGKGSQDYKNAMMDLAKANRWAQMTQRNLMLSMFDMLPFIVLTINGMMKLKTALAERAKATKELAALNATLSRSEVGLAATQKATAGSALLQANGMTVASKAGLGFRGTLVAIGTAAQGLLIRLAPLLAIMAAIGAGVIIYANNIGGLKSQFDALGVALGNAIPQLKGVLTTLGAVAMKLGKGDIQGAIDVLMQKVTGETTLEQISKKDQKAAEELEELYKRVKESSLQFFSDLAFMDKKEQKEGLFNLGIKGGAGKRFKDTLDNYEKFSKTITNFGNAWKTANVAMRLQEYGFKVPDSMFKKIEFTFADRFNKIDKMIKGPQGDIFGKLSDALEKDAKKGGKHFNEIVSDFMKGPDGAKILQMAKDLGFTEFVEAATYIMDKEEEKFMNRVREGVFGINSKDPWYNQIKLNPNPVTHPAITDADRAMLPQSFMDQFPNTFNKEIQLPDAKQNVMLNITDANGNKMDITWKGAQTTIEGIIGTLFHPTEWYKALQNLSKGEFWNSLKTEINNFFYLHLMTNQQANETMNSGSTFEGNIKGITAILQNTGLFDLSNWTNALNSFTTFWADITIEINRFMHESLARLEVTKNDTGSGGIPDFGQGVIGEWLAPLFNLNTWYKTLTLFANPTFWANITKQINSVVQNNLNRLEAKKNEPGSGGIPDVGQGGFGQWIQDTLAPIFDIKNWQSAIDYWSKILNPQLAEAITGSIQPIDPKHDYRNDAPVAHDGHVFNRKTNKWEVPKSGKGPHGMETYPLLGEIVDVAYSTSTDPKTGITTHSGGPSTSTETANALGLEPVPLQGQIVNIFLPDTLAATVGEDTAAIQNLFQTMVANIANVWHTMINGMAEHEAVFANGTIEGFATVYESLVGYFNEIGANWSENMAVVAQNAADAGEGITNEFLDMMDNAGSIFNGVADMWAANCENMSSDAETLADNINSSLDSIEDEEVVITYRYNTIGSKPSDAHAHGTDEMVYKPTLFMAGEQGPERVQVTRAHSEPNWDGSNDDNNGDGSDLTVLNNTINLKISGTDIINNLKFTKKVKMTVGENRSKFGI